MKPLIGVTAEVTHSPKQYSQRESSLSLRYPEAVRRAGGVPVILPLTMDCATLREYLDRCAGLLMSGGGDVAARFYAPGMPSEEQDLIRGADETRDEMEIFLTREAERRGQPILGICRGAQVMNVALGGTLVADIPTLIKNPLPHRGEGDDARNTIRIESDSLLRKVLDGERFSVRCSHHQALQSVAPCFRVTARAADGVIEAVEHRHHPFCVGVQFHPERMIEESPRTLELFATLVREAARYG